MKKISDPVEYDEWYDRYYGLLYAEWMESGASGELDNYFERFCDDKYDEYCKRFYDQLTDYLVDNMNDY